MKNIKIRELKPTDLEAVSALLETREELDKEGAEKRAKLVEWIAFNNPHANGEAGYFVAESSGEIVGIHGRMPYNLVLNGGIIRSHFFHDLYVEPEFRKKGMGFWITMAFARYLENNIEELFCLVGMNQINREMQRRRPYFEMPENLKSYKKFLNPTEQLLKVFKSKLIVKILKPFVMMIMRMIDSTKVRNKFNSVRIMEISRFDEEYDKFYKEIMYKIGISANKDSNWLNWKYIDRPYSVAKVFAAVENDKIKGCIVVGPSKTEKSFSQGLIVDILCDPKDKRIVFTLCSAAVQYFRRQKVHSIACILSNEQYASVFKKLLFFQRPGFNGFMIGNLEKYPDEKDYLMDINNWNITSGESDWYMLNFD